MAIKKWLKEKQKDKPNEKKKPDPVMVQPEIVPEPPKDPDGCVVCGSPKAEGQAYVCETHQHRG